MGGTGGTGGLQYGGAYMFFALLPDIEVPLEVEDRAWAPGTSRPDENPLRP